MLFNSTEFIFAFFPITLVLFYALATVSRSLAFASLIVASLFFYAWWNPSNILVIVPLMVGTYLFAKAIQRLSNNGAPEWQRAVVLVTGIALLVLTLGYFKYLNFFKATLNDVAGTDFVITQVILPLGISFVTFQKIAFLVDVHGGRVKTFSFRDYFLFVLFFPQLIAGPIVHYRETMPQFERHTGRFDATSFAAGLTLFCMGLFKKVVMADGIAAHVSPIYASAASSGGVSLLPAWAAAVGFTLQIYFDFSGYSDMAIGIARAFGIKLPTNFDSPLKASSIIDFWLRWHMTLTRFLTAYIYNPLVLWLTRRRIAKRLPVLGARKTTLGAFLQLLAWPTLLTMLVSGFWHGAGMLFILWGLVHGLYLVVNHAWRFLVARTVTDKARYERWMRPLGFVLTFVAVAVAMVLFRSPGGAAARDILAGMLGLNGVALPRALVEPLGLAGKVSGFISLSDVAAGEFIRTNAWVLALLAVAVLLPNSMQIMARFEPTLDFKESHRPALIPARLAYWAPTLTWAAGVSALAVIAVIQLGGPSEFLYWQF